MIKNLNIAIPLRNEDKQIEQTIDLSSFLKGIAIFRFLIIV